MLKRCLTGVAAVILVLVLISWPMRWMVTGQVVDAETGAPIENAVATIKWLESGPGPPGLAGTATTEEAEDVSDARGRFKLPIYASLLGVHEFRMTVYKKGYICWSTAHIFPKDYIWSGNEQIFPSMKRRTDFLPKDGMIIRMEPLKEHHSKEMHARFTSGIGASIHTRLFYNAIKEERQLAAEWASKKREK
ncbi:MAG TPA: carboxypeptidase-like regulatory domain-containing protein [Syntrophobacter fumaroxidans]|nr:carboxypeptidase-like regulatory domain-containing protein [Syntrophobacter fumaroxidans]